MEGWEVQGGRVWFMRFGGWMVGMSECRVWQGGEHLLTAAGLCGKVHLFTAPWSYLATSCDPSL